MRPSLLLPAAIVLCSVASAKQFAVDPLDHSKWRLVSTEKAGDLEVGSQPATIFFDEGHYTISACNTINGTYSVDSNKLRGSSGVSTRKACQPDGQALDEALLKAVTVNHSFELAAQQLTIMDDDGGTLVFRRVGIPSKRAVTKFIYVGPETKDCASGPAHAQTAGPTAKCLQVRETSDQPWTNFRGKIIGFRPVPGIEYRLRIKEDSVKTLPTQESTTIWYLDMVVEQKVVSKAAPEAGRH